jgi:NAD(P)-dependent dehydrogenase (short-subunit alcohol dehydrogenase family)
MSGIRFDGQVAVVTGAGGGLGKDYALELARRGARVVVNDLGGSVDGIGRASSAADLTVAEIVAAGGEAVANYDSVATAEGGKAIVEQALAAFGSVDVLINNAGIQQGSSFSEMDMDSVHAVIDVHLYGAFHVTQPAFVAMKEKGYGRVVFTSSGAGIFGNHGHANYAAAKMGVVGLMNAVAVEGAEYGIKANTIAPIAKTRMTESKGFLGSLSEFVGLSHVTSLVVYLASRDCEQSHEIWTVGGGRYARVFVGVNQGWFAGKGEPQSAESVRDHLEVIREVGSYTIPADSDEELMLLRTKQAGQP